MTAYQSAARAMTDATVENQLRPAAIMLSALLLCAVSQAGLAQAVPEWLRTRVEQLRATGGLQLDGISIAASTLIPEFYERRAFTPTWTRLEQVDSLIELVESSYLEGLDPAEYHYSAIRQARDVLFGDQPASASERADLDLVLTDSLIRLGYHLRFGKVTAEEFDPHWNFERVLLTDDPVGTIQAAIESDSLLEFINQLSPREFFYERLKSALARYRAIEAAGGWPPLDTAPTLRLGVNDERVPALARRLAVTGDLNAVDIIPENNRYVAALEEGVKTFQERHGLLQDGIVGPVTLATLNVPVARRIEELRANLERTRWVFADVHGSFMVVNIAGFRAYLVQDGEVTWTTRVQVGKPYRKTPVFRSSIEYLVFNPTWTVPPTILAQDILPRVREDPGYLTAENMEIIDSSGAIVDPITVDWSDVRRFPHRLVQGPGSGNALGQVKFILPNPHWVFLHDTPSRELFERQDRAFSSGCIRVESPLELADILLGEEWDRERIDRVIQSAETKTVFLEQPLTVMLLYWTTEVNSEGRVFFLPDLYDWDQPVIDALHHPFDPSLLLLPATGRPLPNKALWSQ